MSSWGWLKSNVPREREAGTCLTISSLTYLLESGMGRYLTVPRSCVDKKHSIAQKLISLRVVL